jgi:hypothetical protein
MTGSKPQLYNGIALLVTFFCCRLVWGTWQSALVYADMWKSIRQGPSETYIASAFSNPATAYEKDLNPMFFAQDAGPIPIWLAAVYAVSNVVLNGLNWHWFYKMVIAVRKRFEPPKPGKREPLPAGAVAKPEVTAGAVDQDKMTVRHRRKHSIEDVVPDIDELRDGTIQ